MVPKGGEAVRQGPDADELATALASAAPTGAPEPGAAFIERTRALSESARESEIAAALLAGVDPPALRGFVEITIRHTIDGEPHSAVLRVAPDYLAVGTDDDFVRIPMYPATAQRVADARGCLLPTRRIVDAIFKEATVKLAPRSMPKGRRGSNEYYIKHQRLIEEQRAGRLLGELTAGHKKDIVVTPRLRKKPGRVAIYGWHRAEGDPVQGLSTVHSARYVDYSHGVRLVSRAVLLDGAPRDLADLLRDERFSVLVSDEGPVQTPRYPA